MGCSGAPPLDATAAYRPSCSTLHHRVLAQDAALGAAAGDDDHRHAAQRGPLGAAGALVELDLVADPLRGAGLVVPGKWHAPRIYPSGRAWALAQDCSGQDEASRPGDTP